MCGIRPGYTGYTTVTQCTLMGYMNCILNGIFTGLNSNLMFENERSVRRDISPGHLPNALYIVAAVSFL